MLEVDQKTDIIYNMKEFSPSYRTPLDKRVLCTEGGKVFAATYNAQNCEVVNIPG